MPPISLAANFLAGSILSLVLPAAVLIAFAIWYVLAVTRITGNPASGVVEKIDQMVNADPLEGADPADPFAPTVGPEPPGPPADAA